MRTSSIASWLAAELIKERGARRGQWYADNWNRWAGTGSYLAPAVTYYRYPAPLMNPAPYTEPDGVQGYEYTLESRYGVAVGEDWLPVAMRRKAAVTLFHPAMLCEAA